MAFDPNNPFAQALISEGQKRGYGPMQIAASIGNAQVENGLRTNGKPGDNGTAFGGFQWRNDRKSALDRTAGKMGLSWDDPSVQATHWWDEQDGSESRWGLRDAKSLVDANTAAISSLRPAGWSAGNPMGVPSASDRLSASSDVYRTLMGQAAQGGQTPSSGSQGDPRAGLPVANAQPIGFSVREQPSATQRGGLPWAGLMDGGPGALFGMPRKDWNLKDALGSAAVAMMALDNPKGAEVLADHMEAKRRAEQDRYTTKYDLKSGKLFKIDSKTGEVTASVVGDPQSQKYTQATPDGQLITYNEEGNIVNRQKAYDPPQKPMGDGLRKQFQSNNDAVDSHYNAASESQKFTKLLMDGKLDLSVLGRMGNDFANYTGHSDERTRNAAAFVAHLERLRNAGLLAAKGVQTEGDAERMMNTLLPGNARYDNKAVGSLLRGITRDSAERYEAAYRYNQPILQRYPDEDPGGYYQGRYGERGKQFKASEDYINDGWERFLSEPKVVAATPGVANGRDPVKGGQTTGDVGVRNRLRAALGLPPLPTGP